MCDEIGRRGVGPSQADAASGEQVIPAGSAAGGKNDMRFGLVSL